MLSDDAVPIIDLFAGPGGLGEGFSHFQSSDGRQRFRIGLSIEKDAFAHETLTLRAFLRQFEEGFPPEYKMFLRGELPAFAFYSIYPHQEQAARREAQRLTLGLDSADDIRTKIDAVVPDHGPWVLIGGPPCQAYSLIGRARNRGVKGYEPTKDERQKLYVEYLQILADHAPAVFVMENVKGLLSATLESRGLFERIHDDLMDPHRALVREHRSARKAPRYELYSFVVPHKRPEQLEMVSRLRLKPADFVIRAENHGIPQARHRVIILGIRSEAGLREPGLLASVKGPGVEKRIGRYPMVRSGLTERTDTDVEWRSLLREIPTRPWFGRIPSEVQQEIRRALRELPEFRADRGDEHFPCTVGGIPVTNHRSKAHIDADIERYMFASAFAMACGRSPELKHFPKALQPAHASAARALDGGHFADRFRVQVGSRPSTTITSHIAKDGHYYIHYDPRQCRSLTVREAASLQTFPDDYFFCGPRTAQYQQVGNAVPPELATQLAAIVAGVLD
jgi:DNA (cytosine-5)-methyltransferase 1